MKKKTYLWVISSLVILGSIGTLAQAAEKKTDTDIQVSTEITTETIEETAVLEDGTYSVKFSSDGSMFRVNEANEGRGILTVKEGEMMLHISLPSKNIVNLFPGLAEEAQKEGAKLLEPTVDTVTYSDGMTDEVHGFDIPVPALDEEFDVALIGKKGKWYDHKVSISDPVKVEEEETEKTTENEK